MAYVTQIYNSRNKSTNHHHRNFKTSNGVLKKHSGGGGGSIARRRIFHMCCGLFIGILLGYSISSSRRRWNSGECGPLRVITGSDGSVLYYPAEDDEPPVVGDEDLLNIESDNNSNNNNSGLSLLFVGVMTAQKYLDSRAVAVYRTWGKQLPGKMAFFSSAISRKPKNASDLPLVRLKGVDDSYPPQKKSFLMLQYMWEHFGDKFEWFMRADDDVYVRPDRIELFLRSIDSGKPYFIGQAGRGNQEEFGLLSLEYDENFCMGGPGIIMSRETLRQVALNVKHCLQNLYTTHEDVELGRCVQKFAKISCTWSYEMQSIFYHNSSGSKAFTGNLKQKEVHRAITLHPVKQHQHMYRIHNYMRGLKIHELQQKKISLHRDVHLTSQLLKLPTSNSLFKNASSLPLPVSSSSSTSVSSITRKNHSYDINRENENDMYETSLFGLQPGLNKFHPRDENDVFIWDMISRSVFSTGNVNPRRRVESYLKEGLGDVIREVMDNINTYSRERGRVIEFQQILYGYYRVNPLYGPDYILDILLTYKKYRGKKMTVPVRRHAYIQQQFTGLEIREVSEGEEVHHHPVPEENGKALEDTLPDDLAQQQLQRQPSKFSRNLPMMFLIPHSEEITTKDNAYSQKLINFILPLSGRYATFERFVRTYEDVCLRRNENVALYVILFVDRSNDTSGDYRRLLTRLQSVYDAGDKIQLVPVYDKFSRAAALDYGMSLVTKTDLLFLIDVDMVWTSHTLSTIRTNTIRGKTAYFPIVFSEYDPSVVYSRPTSPNHFTINDESGYWRQFGFGIVSIYKEDITKVGGFNTSIRGWGKEDVDFFEKLIVQPTNVTIFRSADPHLVHVFHIVDCDPSLDTDRLIMCRNSRTETYGSVNQLANLVYRNKINLFNFAGIRTPKPTKPS